VLNWQWVWTKRKKLKAVNMEKWCMNWDNCKKQVLTVGIIGAGYAAELHSKAKNQIVTSTQNTVIDYWAHKLPDIITQALESTSEVRK
jgi:hypothetical protein